MHACLMLVCTLCVLYTVGVYACSVCVCPVYSVCVCVCVLPDRGVQLVAGVLLVVQLGEQGEEHLHPSDGVDPALD